MPTIPRGEAPIGLGHVRSSQPESVRARQLCKSEELCRSYRYLSNHATPSLNRSSGVKNASLPNAAYSDLNFILQMFILILQVSFYNDFFHTALRGADLAASDIRSYGLPVASLPSGTMRLACPQSLTLDSKLVYLIFCGPGRNLSPAK
jgi:hypothetical protein